MSITDLKAFELSWVIGARKLPAAPALLKINGVQSPSSDHSMAYMTKSIPPSSLIHLSTADCKLSILLTSTAPKPKTFAPFLAVAISLAIFSVFSTFLPTIQAFAPRCTSALTCALQMEPAPPVQKTTLLSEI